MLGCSAVGEKLPVLCVFKAKPAPPAGAATARSSCVCHQLAKPELFQYPTIWMVYLCNDNTYVYEVEMTIWASKCLGARHLGSSSPGVLQLDDYKVHKSDSVAELLRR